MREEKGEALYRLMLATGEKMPTRFMMSRRFTLALVLAGATMFGLFSNTAWADKVALSGTYSQTGILASCTKAGGQFNSDDSGFGCYTDKGSVQCNTNGKCTGECDTCGKGPAIAHRGRTIFGVLSGTTLKAAGTSRSLHVSGSSHNAIVDNSSKPVREISHEHSGGGKR